MILDLAETRLCSYIDIVKANMLKDVLDKMIDTIDLSDSDVYELYNQSKECNERFMTSDIEKQAVINAITWGLQFSDLEPEFFFSRYDLTDYSDLPFR